MVKLMATTNTFTLVLYRSFIQILISFVTLIRQGKNPLGPSSSSSDSDTTNVRLWLFIRAFFGAVAVCAWFFGIQQLPLPDAVTLQFTTPAFAAIFAVFMVGEPWKPLDMIGAVVCLTGVAFIAHPTWLFGPSASVESAAPDDATGTSDVLMKALAVLVTTGGAACAGVAYVAVRKIGDRASAVVMVLYYGVISVPMCIFGSGLLANDWNVFSDPQFETVDYLLIVLMGLGGYGGQFFTNLGLQNETAATATLATSTQIVWTYIFELAFLHELIDPWSLGGTGLILGYMMLVAALKIFQSEPHDETPSEHEARTAEERKHLLAEEDVARELDV